MNITQSCAAKVYIARSFHKRRAQLLLFVLRLTRAASPCPSRVCRASHQRCCSCRCGAAALPEAVGKLHARAPPTLHRTLSTRSLHAHVHRAGA